jgi:hypothetical protein
LFLGASAGASDFMGRPTSWVGKTVNGYMCTVSESTARLNFSDQYLNKLVANEGKFFSIPIGDRSSGISNLPSHFPLIPTTCLTSQRGKHECCVGFGFAAALQAFGDPKWSTIRDLAPAAVEAVAQSAHQHATPSKMWNEIEYYKAHCVQRMRNAYEVLAPPSYFDPSAMLEHDIAVCQV